MEQKLVQFRNRGMRQDESISKASDEFAFKNVNVRITAVNDNTLFSVTNERLSKEVKIYTDTNKISLNLDEGTHILTAIAEYPVSSNVVVYLPENKRITITRDTISAKGSEVFNIEGAYVGNNRQDDYYYYYVEGNKNYEKQQEYSLKGTYCGNCIVGDYLILFTYKIGNEVDREENTRDYIYRLHLEKDDDGNDVFKCKTLCAKNIGLCKPVECVGNIEREDIQKVYWVDGVNPNRVINIMADKQPSSFDFLPTVSNIPEVAITKQYGGNGKFPAGVIQYFISYYNKLGQETKLVWASGLQYILLKDRGGKADEIINCYFTLNISNIDTNFEYLRLYSAKRTSIDGPIDAQIVGDYKILGTTLSIVDNNVNTEAIDATLLYYIGGNIFIASTIEDKDGVLFFGDISISSNKFTSDEINVIKDTLKECIGFNDNISDASYLTNQTGLDDKENLKSFKYDEWYRIAVQFQFITGEFSEPIFLKDIKCELPPIVNNDFGVIYKQCVYLNWPDNVSNDFDLAISKCLSYRLLMAQTSNSTRRVIAQGILNPTVFNVQERAANSPYVINSWVSRPRGGKAKFYHMENLAMEDIEYTDGEYISSWDCRAEIQGGRMAGNVYKSSYRRPVVVSTGTQEDIDEIISHKSYDYYVDETYFSLNSPEITYGNIWKYDNIKFRIVGVAPIETSYSDSIIQTDNVYSDGVHTYGKVSRNIFSGPQELLNDYIYKAYLNPDGSFKTYYLKTFLWHKTGSMLGNFKYNDNNFILKHKIFSNYLTNNGIKYFTNPFNTSIDKYEIFNGVSNELKLDSKEFISLNYDKLVASEIQGYGIYYRPTTTAEKPTDLLDDQYGLCNDPCRIKFNSTPCAIIGNGYKLLPYLSENTIYTGFGDDKDVESAWELNKIYENLPSSWKYLWKTVDGDLPTYSIQDKHPSGFKTVTSNGYIQNALIKNINQYLFVGEIYRDITAEECYGSTNENIRWIPISKQTKKGENVTITYGDTYYQRWECLRTYPTTEEDENSVVDIVSFMVETHINLDGRCDINKGYTNTINARPTNYGLMNDVYSQTNNIFTYNILDNRFDYNRFPNQFTWSLNKSETQIIDPWTSATLSNIKNVNGNYGKINAIEKFNDTLIVFQDRAICTINFNNRTQISTEQGLPIELANSGKIDGVTYITRNYGCKNKYSIVNTKSGIYFIDDENKSLIRFGKDGLSIVSTAAGMSVWFNRQTDIYNKLWNGGDVDGTFFILQYDSIRGDIYIIKGGESDEACLVYNEMLDCFTSFFDNSIGYKFSLIYNINGYSFGLNANKFYELFGSADYSNQYNIDYRVNPEPLEDKTFTNIEYIADVISNNVDIDSDNYDSNIYIGYQPFNKLDVWNEYQSASTDKLQSIGYSHQDQRSKFRIRRVDIPRPSEHFGLNRIRNPWIHLKLSGGSINNNKMIFHSLTVKYFK